MSSTVQPRVTPSITHAAALALELKIQVAVAITDAGGHLVAFERTDGAPFLTGDVAIRKAWTAFSYGIATHVWNDYIADPEVAPLANLHGLMPVGFDVPG